MTNTINMTPCDHDPAVIGCDWCIAKATVAHLTLDLQEWADHNGHPDDLAAIPELAKARPAWGALAHRYRNHMPVHLRTHIPIPTPVERGLFT